MLSSRATHIWAALLLLSLTLFRQTLSGLASLSFHGQYSHIFLIPLIADGFVGLVMLKLLRLLLSRPPLHHKAFQRSSSASL